MVMHHLDFENAYMALTTCFSYKYGFTVLFVYMFSTCIDAVFSYLSFYHLNKITTQ